MRILYDYQIFIRQKYGGISRYFYELIRQALQQEGMEVSFCQGLHVNYYQMADQKKLFRDYFGIQHNKIYKTGPILSLLNKSIFRHWLNKRRRDVNIYHPTYYYPETSVGAKTVMTVYDMIHEKYPQYLKGAKEFSDNKRRVLARMDKILAISENTKNDLIELFSIPPEKIEVVPLAASDSFRTATSAERSSFLLRRGLDRPYLLYVGDRAGYKNFITLLKAFSQWPKRTDYQLVCVGNAGNYSNEETEIIVKQGLGDKIKLFSGISDEELRLFYANAQALVVTSLYEGFGITPLEAMRCGTPVIVSNSSSLPEVVGEAGMYYQALEPEELLLCLDKITGNAAARAEYINKGLARSSKFSWEKTAADTFKAYQQLIS